MPVSTLNLGGGAAFAIEGKLTSDSITLNVTTSDSVFLRFTILSLVRLG
jgi:hypothetical protein